MKIKLFILLLTIYPIIIYCQTKDNLVYAPVSNVPIEDVWPAVKAQLDFNKMDIEFFNYPTGQIQTTWLEYYSGLLKKRGKFLFQFENNTLNILFIDIQLFSDDKNVWEKSSSSGLFKTEDKMRARTALGIQNILNTKPFLDSCKNAFYTDLKVQYLFYQYATELAGQRWFEKYLKDRKVIWFATFNEIKNNSMKELFNTKYTEYYSIGYNNNVLTNELSIGIFYIMRFTNSEENLLTSKGKFIKLEGFCKSLSYSNGVFIIDLIDNEIDIQNKSNNDLNKNKIEDNQNYSKADEILKLKKLLDDGLITKEEFEKEKQKILSK